MSFIVCLLQEFSSLLSRCHTYLPHRNHKLVRSYRIPCISLGGLTIDKNSFHILSCDLIIFVILHVWFCWHKNWYEIRDIKLCNTYDTNLTQVIFYGENVFFCNIYVWCQLNVLSKKLALMNPLDLCSLALSYKWEVHIKNISPVEIGANSNSEMQPPANDKRVHGYVLCWRFLRPYLSVLKIICYLYCHFNTEQPSYKLISPCHPVVPNWSHPLDCFLIKSLALFACVLVMPESRYAVKLVTTNLCCCRCLQYFNQHLNVRLRCCW